MPQMMQYLSDLKDSGIESNAGTAGDNVFPLRLLHEIHHASKKCFA